MRVISFDQSTRRSGYAIFENGQYIESGVVDMNKSKLETGSRKCATTIEPSDYDNFGKIGWYDNWLCGSS